MRSPASLTVPGAQRNDLHLVDWGGEGPGLLLLHGMGAHTGWWDPVLPFLPPGRRVVAMDFRGHGDSAWAEPYTLDEHAADVEAVRRALGWERFALAAHSMGARAAIRYARAGLARLECLALLDFFAADWKGRERAGEGWTPPTYPDEDAILSRFRLQPSGTALGPDALRELGRRGVRRDEKGLWRWKFDWRAVYPRQAWDPAEPAGLELPVLLIRGELSATMPRAAFKSVLSALPDARGLELPGAHHHVTLDAPRAVGEALASFLGEVSGSTGRPSPRSRAC